MNAYQKLLKEAKGLLPELIKATNDKNVGFLFLREEIRDLFVKKGWAEVNKTVVQEGTGDLATRATPEGIAECPDLSDDNPDNEDGDLENVDNTKKQEEKPVVQTTSTFVIEDVPVVKKRATSGNPKYPFDQLGIGQSFFVPATTARPEPWKSLAGAITVAHNIFSELVFEKDSTTPTMRTKRGSDEQVQATKKTRQFVITKDTVDGVDGARMGRVAL